MRQFRYQITTRDGKIHPAQTIDMKPGDSFFALIEQEPLNVNEDQIKGIQFCEVGEENPQTEMELTNEKKYSADDYNYLRFLTA